MDESLQRLIRIETRLTRLSNHMGLDPTDNAPRLFRTGDDWADVGLIGFDTTLAEILAFCRKQGMIGPVRLIHRGEPVGSVINLEGAR